MKKSLSVLFLHTYAMPASFRDLVKCALNMGIQNDPCSTIWKWKGSMLSPVLMEHPVSWVTQGT